MAATPMWSHPRVIGRDCGGAGRGGEVGSGGTACGPIEIRCGADATGAVDERDDLARTIVASAYFLCRPMRFQSASSWIRS